MNNRNISLFVLISVIIGMFLALGIASTIIAGRYENLNCMGSYKGISISYGTWLMTNGIVHISVGTAAILLLIYYILTRSNCVGVLFIIITVLEYGYEFCWYLFGAVLFFQEMSEHCADGQPPIYQFSLVIYILQTLIWSSVCLGITCGSSIID